MSRRASAVLAALALFVQTGSALAAFALEPAACCCAKMPPGHHCHCPTCAHARENESDRCSFGGCSDTETELLPQLPARPFLPVPKEAKLQLPAPVPAVKALPAPPPAPILEVPTPPPLAWTNAA